MIAISRDYSFSAAHRLEGHPKCGRLHGHNYDVTVTLACNEVPHGMLLDYGEMDRLIKPIINELDHKYIIAQSNIDELDPYYYYALQLGHGIQLPLHASTAEELAKYLHDEIRTALAVLSLPKFLITVLIKETPKSTAVYYDEQD